jgi:hypothetical protein
MFSGCEVDMYEDPLQQMCEDVEAMKIIAQGGRCNETRGMGNGAGTKMDRTTEDWVGARTAPSTFSFRIFGV